MKRIIALLMILVMIFSFAGCKKKEKKQPQYADGGTQNAGTSVDLSSFEGKRIKPYLELIASRNFYYQKAMSDGSMVTFTCIGQDEKISLSQGASFIKTGDGRIYYVEGNYYFELTDALVTKEGLEAKLEDIKTVLASYEALIFGMLEFVPKELDKTYDAPGYVHEEYMDVENNYAYSFFFNESTGELASVVEVSNLTSGTYDVKLGVPSANAISNTFTNGTLVDSQEAMNELSGNEAQGGANADANANANAGTNSTTVPVQTTTP